MPDADDKIIHDVVWNLHYGNASYHSMRQILIELASQCTLKTNHVVQLLQGFGVSDRVDLFEILLPRIKDLNDVSNQQALGSLFKANHREHIKQLIDLQPPNLFEGRNVGANHGPKVLFKWTEDDIDDFLKLVRTQSSSNATHLLRAFADQKEMGLTGSGLFLLLRKLVASNPVSSVASLVEDILNILEPFIWHLSTADVIKLLNYFGKRCPVIVEPLLVVVVRKICDPEHLGYFLSSLDRFPVLVDSPESKAILEHAFLVAKLKIQDGPWYECSPYFGNLVQRQKRRIVFLVDGSAIGSTPTKGDSKEVMPLIHFVIRDLSRVLKDHLLSYMDKLREAPGSSSSTEVGIGAGTERTGGGVGGGSSSIYGTSGNDDMDFVKRNEQEIHFNIVTFNSAVRAWSDKMEVLTRENVNNATLFLRSIQPKGSRNLEQALGYIFEQSALGGWEIDDVEVVTFGPPHLRKSKISAQKMQTLVRRGAQQQGSGRFDQTQEQQRQDVDESEDNASYSEDEEDEEDAVGEGGGHTRLQNNGEESGFGETGLGSRSVTLEFGSQSLQGGDGTSRTTKKRRKKRKVYSLHEKVDHCVDFLSKVLFDSGLKDTVTINAVFLIFSQTRRTYLSETTRLVKEIVKLPRENGHARIFSLTNRVTRVTDIFKMKADDAPLDMPTWGTYLLQGTIFVSYVLMLILSAEFSVGHLSDFSCLTMDARYPQYLSILPTDNQYWRFVMLGYAGLVLFTNGGDALRKASPGQARRMRILVTIVPFFTLYCVSVIVSVYFYTKANLPGALVFAILQCVFMSFLHAGLVCGRRVVPFRGAARLRVDLEGAKFWEPVLLRAPISIGLATSFFLVFQLLSMLLLVDLGLGSSLEFVVSVSFVAIQFGVALYLVLAYSDSVYGMTVAILLYLVNRSLASSASHLRYLAQQRDMDIVSGEAILQILIFISCLVLFFFSTTKIISKMFLSYINHHKDRLYGTFGSQEKWAKLPREATRILTLQGANLTSYVILGFLYWGRPSIASEGTCSNSIRYVLHEDHVSPLVMMISRYAFIIAWPLLYVWRGVFVIAQLFPPEMLCTNVQDMKAIRDRDMEIAHKSFFRQDSKQYDIPHMTWRFQLLLEDKVGYLFVGQCMWEGIFVLSFNNGQFWVALVALVLLWAVSIFACFNILGPSLLNTFSSFFCSFVCCHYPKQKRKQRKQQQQQGQGQQNSTRRKSKRRKKRSWLKNLIYSWYAKIFRLRTLTRSERIEYKRKDTSGSYDMTPLNKCDRSCTWNEFFLFRVPFGLYLGWVTYLVFLQINMVVVNSTGQEEENGGDEAGSSYFVAEGPIMFLSMTSFIYFALFCISYRLNNMYAFLGLGWCLVFKMVSDWFEVCDATSYSGFWIRKRTFNLGAQVLTGYGISNEEQCIATTHNGSNHYVWDEGHCYLVIDCPESDVAYEGFSEAINGSCTETLPLCPWGASGLDYRAANEYVVGWTAFIFLCSIPVVMTYLWCCTPSRIVVRRTEFLTKIRKQRMMDFSDSEDENEQ